MKAIKNVATNATFVVREDENVMIAELKAAGIKFGKTSLKELLEGKRPQVNGFEVVELEEATNTTTAGAENGGAAESNGDAAGGDQGATGGDAGTTDGAGNNAGDAGSTNQGGDAAPVPGNQGGTPEQHAAAGAQSHKNDGDQPTPNAANGGQLTPEPAAGGNKPAPQPRQRKVIKAAEPKGKIKPVRKGTKIANGLDMLAAGCTEKQLEDAEMSDDIVDFVNRRVTKRGYGIEVSGEGAAQIIKLKFPAGTTGVQYTTAGGGDDDGDAAPAGNTPAADNAAPANTPADDAEPAAPAADAAPADQAAQA